METSLKLGGGVSHPEDEGVALPGRLTLPMNQRGTFLASRINYDKYHCCKAEELRRESAHY